MKIAVELNNIIRDYNTQLIKYYIKGCDPNFDDETVDLGSSDILPQLPFPSNKDRKIFKEIDYPYELFGCAKTMHKHLHVDVSKWLENNENDEIIYFSLGESNLNIQSTYFFLSKGSRVRTMLFPKKPQDIWKHCDVAVTLNKNVLKTKPLDKISILIRKSDNKKLEKYANLVYDSFDDILKDENFKEKIENKNTNEKKKNNLFNKMVAWMKK